MEPLEVAIQMENDGKEFYLKSSENSTDGLGKSLFARLAVEEEFHAAKAREIHASLSRGETPLMIEDSLDRGTKLKSNGFFCDYIFNGELISAIISDHLIR